MLDKEQHVPLLVQLKHEIEKKIVEKVYTDQIPSERELMKEYNVSRSTVREAINSLVKEGFLVKSHGRGTYVSIKSLDKWLGHLSSTTETIQALGKEPGAKLIQFVKTSSPEHVKKITGCQETYFLKRIRLADNKPIGIEQQYYPLYIGKFLENYNLDDITLYDVIQNELAIPFSEANQKISCSEIPKKDLKYLELNAADTDSIGALKAERIIKDRNAKVIEYEEAFYRSDMYTFEFNLARKFS